jgi:hypothetical protein
VIGKIVLTMLVAAAKINQSSIVPAFDQTRVPRIIQVPSGGARKPDTTSISFIDTEMKSRDPISYDMIVASIVGFQ